MQDTAKYLIHADITAEGVVERSDVVGAIFGQTEGLLGDELDLRDLQDASKVGRIDVEIDSENGQSFGTVTIASGLDQVETAILGAALESIERVGPCRATVEVKRIEDVRAAKRRAIVERAKELLDDAFDGSMLTSQELVEEVRRSIRVEDITEYEGLPAGPRVADSDAIIVVEGRADVLTLLRYGIKNAVAVEGTNVPDAVADLTADRTVTAFFDGDRGGNLILKELAQVGDVDYIASAPAGRSVEDLDRGEVMRALREKVPYEAAGSADDSPVAGRPSASDGGSATAPPGVSGGPAGPPARGDAGTATESGGAETADDAGTVDSSRPPPDDGDQPGVAPDDGDPPLEPSPDAGGGTETETAADESPDGADAGAEAETASESGSENTDADADATTGADADTDADAESAPDAPAPESDEPPDSPGTLRGHAEAVVDGETGRARLLDGEFVALEEGPAEDAFDLVEGAETVPETVVLDGEVTQRLLDVAAQRGVDQVVGRSTGEFVKRPTSVRVRTAEELLARDDDPQ